MLHDYEPKPAIIKTKNHEKFFLLVVIAFCFYACHKNEATPLLEEHPMEDFLYTNAKTCILKTDAGYE